ncbi:hypothetical protein T265_08400 [Opisthorchis viverrini]|uniref:Uncharacterized protein n=1 Tax=Opisthorchis viverrini TaxID=6198 RepID=A0A074ZDV1_OPIVI|nr:hypothetical protein T265_08400 [Opisthorchis viverrini]KER23812.1 hypothetical protein T265_08400 [Opisthorchis viverrini]
MTYVDEIILYYESGGSRCLETGTDGVIGEILLTPQYCAINSSSATNKPQLKAQHYWKPQRRLQAFYRPHSPIQVVFSPGLPCIPDSLQRGNHIISVHRLSVNFKQIAG